MVLPPWHVERINGDDEKKMLPMAMPCGVTVLILVLCVYFLKGP